MKKIVSLCILYTLCAVTVQAQTTVSGRVVSAKDHSAIEMATVRLFRYHKADSTLVQGTTTDLDGNYQLTGVRAGTYKIWYNVIGYQSKRIDCTVKTQPLQLSVVRLSESVKALNEVVVQGKAAEMTVKGDTLEYNTSAYKMEQNANVEDLLKKMSGVQVDADGNVQVNGEKITAVRIDGKKFFGSDVQAATKNIPAEMIEKIQVLDEKSDMAKMTGIEDDDTERIINLTLKSDRKKGVFGNYRLGAGADMVGVNTGEWFRYNPQGETAAARAADWMKNDFRYSGNLFTNIMLGESQTTIIGSAGNTNEIRTGRGRDFFMGGQNEGITRAENLGVNTNIDLTSRLRNPREGASLLLGGDASVNHSNTDKRSTQDQTLYSTDLTYHNLDSSLSVGKTWDAQVRLELEYKADAKNKLIIKPELSYTNSQSDGTSYYTYDKDSTTIKDGNQYQYSLSENINAGLQVLYSHGFSKAGRLLSLDAKIGLTDTKGNSTTQAWNNLLSLNDVDQKVASKSNALSYSAKVSWLEPIYGKEHFLEAALSFKGNHRTSNKDQHSMDTITGSETIGQYIYDPVYSNRMKTDFFQEILELNYQLKKTNYDLTLGAQFNPSQTHSVSYYGDELARDTLIKAWNWSPNASLKFKFGKRDFLRLRYRGQSSQPSVSQMEPVRNNSNSMAESVGNLGLNPSFGHTLMAMYSKYNQDRMSSIMTGVRGTLTQSALVENSIYDQTGKRYSQTVNADAIPWNINADFMYNTPFANKLMQFHSRTSLGYNQRVAYVLREQDAAYIEDMITNNTFLRGDASYTGNLQVSEDANLRFTYNWVDLGVNGQVTYNRTTNSLTRNLSNTVSWTVKGDLAFHLPKSWNISADCSYTSRWGYQLTDVNEVILNAKIDKTWGNATLALEAKDLLHQQKNIVQVVSADAVTYKKFNTLPTYFMLSFTYKLNRMGDLKAKGAAGFMQEMIEQGGTPGTPPRTPPTTPPAGPPPGM